ncbi:hypothetical protein J2T17_002762 [Paenibacillus mucilaginosus]
MDSFLAQALTGPPAEGCVLTRRDPPLQGCACTLLQLTKKQHPLPVALNGRADAAGMERQA